MQKQIPTSIPTPNPPYMQPHRPFAFEALVLAAVNQSHPRPITYLDIVHYVERLIDWSHRNEIHQALVRLVKSSRICTHYIEGRTLPLYELPDAIPAPASPAS